MRPRTGPCARRIGVPAQEPLLGGAHYDYADAFEIRADPADPRAPEEFARAALDDAPGHVRWLVWNVHRHVLRFRQGPRSSPDHVLGWTIRTSAPDVVHLEARSPLLRAELVGRRPEPDRVVVTTYVVYERRTGARLFEAIVGPLHRRVAPLLMEHGAAAFAAELQGARA